MKTNTIQLIFYILGGIVGALSGFILEIGGLQG